MLSDCAAEAVANFTVGNEASLLSALHVCTATTAACVSRALSEAAVAGLAKPEAAARAAVCVQKPDAESVMGAVLQRLQTIFGFFNLAQLIFMPWAFFWMFSSYLLLIWRFFFIQYELLRVTFDTMVLPVLHVLCALEHAGNAVLNDLFLCFQENLSSSAVIERRRLIKAKDSAKTFAEHCEADEALTAFVKEHNLKICCGGPRRQQQAEVASGTVEEYEKVLLSILGQLSDDTSTKKNLAILEPLFVRDAGGVDWQLQSHGEEYLKKLEECLFQVCASVPPRSPDGEELLGWLRARQRALGCTALCLSGGGSLAMYHMGVCRFLLQQGLMPSVVSAVSGGSIVGAFLAIHTDEEILDHVFATDIVIRHPPHRWFPVWWKEVINFLRIGVLVPTNEFEETALAFFGHWTFEEAFARTRRPVSIVLSTNFSQKLPKPVMLNHMTAPQVVIASAVAASCTAMGVMMPRGLLKKDPATGELQPFDALGRSFSDGSFVGETPKDYLRSAFGATHFIVSQVNPHASAFIDLRGGLFERIRSSVGADMQKRARRLSEYHFLPSFFGKKMQNVTKHLAQDFGEDRDGITLLPPDMGLSSVKQAVSNPSVKDMERYISGGQRMAWNKGKRIRALMQMEVALSKAVFRMEGIQSSPASRDQPPKLKEM